MKKIISPRVTVDYFRPGQALTDLKNAGFTELVLDLEISAGAGFLENYGTPKYKSNPCTSVIDDTSKMSDFIANYVEKAHEKGFAFNIAQAPFLIRNTKRKDLTGKLKELILESISICGRMKCEYLILRPDAGFTDEIYLEFAGKAGLNGVTLLLENQCKIINGHFVRGMMSDEREAAEYLARMNAEAETRFGKTDRDYFGFCMNVGTCCLCGQNMYDFAVTLGGFLKAVILRDCNGDKENSLLPFTAVNGGVSQTDWLNLIRGLRQIGFDGDLVMDIADTTAAFSVMLKPGLFSLAKNIMDYFAWQISMERVIEKYASRVLFGAGNMCRNYMKNYGEKYPPLYTCDNNSSLWGQTFEGLEIHNPADLLKLPEDCAIFICNIYYREIEEQLRQMGVTSPIEFFNDEYMPTFYFDRLDSLTRKSDKEDM